jgi:hypothetical protein
MFIQLDVMYGEHLQPYIVNTDQILFVTKPNPDLEGQGVGAVVNLVSEKWTFHTKQHYSSLVAKLTDA